MKKILIPLFAVLFILPLGAAPKEAAVEYLVASGVPQMLKRSFDALLEAQLRATPELEKVRPELTKFFADTFSFEAMRDDLAAIYLKYYTEKELKELTAFYRTPIGRKKAKVDGAISPELSALIQRKTEEKIPELQKTLQKLMLKKK